MIFKIVKLMKRCGMQTVWGKLNDYFLRIKTEDRNYCASEVDLNKISKYQDSIGYEPADYNNIRRIIRILEPNKDDIFYDLGCGMGRVICVFARLKIQCAVGIDIDAFLCDVARMNAKHLRKRRSPIEIRCEDAVFSNLAGGTIYFMYNPFAVKTLSNVLKKIEDSLITSPRYVRIVYYNTVFEELFLKSQWLSRFAEIRTQTGKRITFWDNLPYRVHLI